MIIHVDVGCAGLEYPPFVVELPHTDPSLTYEIDFSAKLDCSLHLFTRASDALSRLDCGFFVQANGAVRLYVGNLSPTRAAMFLAACRKLSAAVAAYRAHWGVRTLSTLDSAYIKRFMYAEALAEEAKRDEGQDVALLLSDERAKNATLHDRIKELEEWQRGVIRTNVLEYADRCSCPRCELIRKLRKDAHLDE